MGLDFILEADDRLSEHAIRSALKKCGVSEVETEGEDLVAYFPSWLTMRTGKPSHSEIVAEDRRCSFEVSRRCYFRVKGEAPGLSALEDIGRFAEAIFEVCDAFFIVSFQFEETTYWRDSHGLHKA